jgi:predicted site-specific integrase-resolvase
VAYFQILLKTQGDERVIVNEAKERQEGLMRACAAIVTSFTARRYGRRPAGRKHKC